MLTIVRCSGSESGRGDAASAVASVCPVGQSTCGRTVTFMPGAALVNMVSCACSVRSSDQLQSGASPPTPRSCATVGSSSTFEQGTS